MNYRAVNFSPLARALPSAVTHLRCDGPACRGWGRR
nr:MAG TPA: hypothetical protein [Caudoviricetes sp.]